MNLLRPTVLSLLLALITASCSNDQRNSAMLADDHINIARQFYEEVINKADLELASKIVHNNFVDHGNPPNLPQGIEGLKQFLAMISNAFPDIHVKVEDMVAQNDRVAVRLTVTGTHKGVLMGTIPPSGKQATWSGMDFLRISEGKIAERWAVRDLLGMMRQIGAINP